MSQHLIDFQLEAEGPVPSPCINICKMDAQKTLCLGCFRTIPEIVAWSRADDAFKRSVWREIKLRVAQSSK